MIYYGLSISHYLRRKKMEKKKEVTEDDSKEGQENIQKLTDKKIKAIDEIKAKKEKEVMAV